MGFYYNAGSGEPPEEPGGSWRETFYIIAAVFRALALPLAIMMGGLGYLVFVFWMFTIHPLAGLAAIGLVVAAIAARGVWEARHPPDLTKL